MDYTRVRRIVLDDRFPQGYRPTLTDIRLMRRYLPGDARILGFGPYPHVNNMFYLLVESDTFAERPALTDMQMTFLKARNNFYS